MLQLRYMGVICVIWYKIFTVFQNYWGGGSGPPWPPLVSATGCVTTVLRGRLHGKLSTPGLNSALLTGLNLFAITWTISTPGLKRYTICSRHRFPEVKKALILFSCNK
jgi:hypothetical protein